MVELKKSDDDINIPVGEPFHPLTTIDTTNCIHSTSNHQNNNETERNGAESNEPLVPSRSTKDSSFTSFDCTNMTIPVSNQADKAMSNSEPQDQDQHAFLKNDIDTSILQQAEVIDRQEKEPISKKHASRQTVFRTPSIIRFVSLSMVSFGVVILLANLIVSLGQVPEINSKTNGILSQMAVWITCNAPNEIFGQCLSDLQIEEPEFQQIDIEFVDQVLSLVNLDSLPNPEDGLQEWMSTGDENEQIQLVDRASVAEMEQEFLENMRPDGEGIVTIDDYSFLQNARHIPRFEKNRTQIGVENATLFMLVRNIELSETLQTMREIEDRFNKKYRYPWTFLNDVPFTDEFKELTTGMASGKTEYGLVPEEFWSLPDFIQEDKFEECLADFVNRSVIYGGSVSYRHMCRFNSGFFFRQELMNQYRYYWRVEPGTRFFCDQRYDPFTFMREYNKTYGFVIAIPEYDETIPTLWRTVEEFFNEHPEYLASDSAKLFLTDKNHARRSDMVMTSGSDYNLCHFWSNFEIGDLDFFRGKEYLDYFNHLDRAGGFFYERWGDAPVHTIGVVMMLNKSQIHHFSDMGYKHVPYYRCPHDDESYLSGRCYCGSEEPEGNTDFQPFSCLPKWWIHGGPHFLHKYKDDLILL